MSTSDSIGDPSAYRPLDALSRGVAADAAFFSVSNQRDFLGIVALVNSLREVGHDESFYLADCGLTEEQRAILREHVRLVEAPTDVPPPLLKTYAPLTVDPSVALILDADVIVLEPLTDLVADSPVFFLDPVPTRFFREWSRLDLGRVQPVPYVNSGHMIVPRESGFLPHYQDAIERMLEIVRAEPATCRTPQDPFYYPDQDALNALLGTLQSARYTVSDEAAYWPFETGLEQARLLHHILPKPWLTSLRPNPYSRRMVRLLAAGPVLVPQKSLPAHFRESNVGALARAERSLRHNIRDATRGRIGVRARWRPPSTPYLPELGGR